MPRSFPVPVDFTDADIHRIGGSSVENLGLKEAEAALDPAGISVLRADTPAEAASQLRQAFPMATVLHETASIVATTSEQLIQTAGFELVANPTRRLPNHYRITHPDGASGFSEENLEALSGVFVETSGH